MFKATVIEAFIATPSDIVQERNVIREIIDEWNIVHSKSRLAIIKCLGWENDIYSSLSEGRPQECINKQVLEGSDLLIGVFWTRIGTPTGNYISGSVEEIKIHINTKKPVMLFFSNIPVRMDSVDAVQYEKLCTFKEWCYNQGLVTPYENVEDFINLFRRQLGLLMNKDQIILEMINQKIYSDNNAQDGVQLKIMLSEIAEKILTEVAQDNSGQLLALMTLGGYIVKTNGKNLCSDQRNPRSDAVFKAAIEELEFNDLIRAANYKREFFTITAKGYDFLDK